MEIQICKDSQGLAEATSRWCETKSRLSGAKSVYLPAGSTPIPIYKTWNQNPPEFLSSMKLIQIDDVLTGPKAGMFKNFFIEHLPTMKDRFCWIGDTYEQGDLAILGLGLNGHIAFHEPELPKNFYSGCVRLSDKTCQTLGLNSPTWGITYGASAFLKAKAILMVVSGSSKKEVLERLLKKDPNLPAAALAQHSDFTILADTASYPQKLTP